MIDLEHVHKAGLADLGSAESLAELETARVRHLGRKAPLSVFLRSLKDLSEEERRSLGAQANTIRQQLEERFAERKKELSGGAAGTRRFDITHPAPRLPQGHVHPLTLVQEDIGRIFSAMGFKVLEGPEIETEYNNFDALNIPPDHPARDMQDTFWVKEPKDSRFKIQDSRQRYLLRTHTSPMQIRYMETHEPPLRIVVPGRVYRHEATDMTHDFQFHQVEGLAVGNDISLANLKGVLEHFFREFFRDVVQVRFVQRYFPFTEPSVEVEIKGKKGRLKDRWIEVAGAGMVHQNVLKAVGYVPGRWQGFAFGMAIERIAMLKYKVDDIRLFQGGDVRFLEQF